MGQFDLKILFSPIGVTLFLLPPLIFNGYVSLLVFSGAFSKIISSAPMTHRDLNLVSLERVGFWLSNGTTFKSLHAMEAEKKLD